ncbi:EF-hand domain-containing protein [Pseudomonas sp. B21-054]|uniref:XopAW family type III secretion system calcium-binding effector n=1 Tax=Pseudomonas sp. B21-054 TaxID=2895494 RepID=UPI002231D206|nr:XopAW family type III secretion system calcium-binding effector [Pseudomonas sp. B21-054]UZE16489.1 EF-hand domain-containing protein [Pseudomonas sp. B21-054]
MIGSVSSYPTYTSTSSTTSNSARIQQFQKELLSKLDSNADGSVDQDELSSALSQKSDDGILVSLSDNFDDLDSDGSGDLSGEEMAAMAPPPPLPRDQAPDTELADALLSALDTDEDGTVSSDELSSGLTSAGSSVDSQQVFSALDKNEDSTVSLDELAASLAPPPTPPQQASSEELFSQLDTDGDGSVTASELTSALQAGRSSDSSTDQANVSEALNRMIANLSRQYSLDNVATVGKHLNVAT